MCIGTFVRHTLVYQLKNLYHILRSFPCFAVQSSSAHEDKIIISERFHCSLTNIIQLN